MKQFLFAVIIAGAALAGLDQLTSLSTEWKIGISAAIFLVGSLLAKSYSKTTASAPSAQNAAPTPTPTAGTVPTPVPANSATLRGAIGNILVALLLIASLSAVGIWLYRQLADWADSEAAKLPAAVNVAPMGHSNVYVEGKSFKNWIHPGIEYYVFELKQGWRWRWFFDYPIYYRVRLTGKEKFDLVEESGSEFSVDYDGRLEIKTDYNNNWVSITQRIYHQTRMNEHQNE